MRSPFSTSLSCRPSCSHRSALARKAANKALDAKLKARPAKRKRVEVAEEVITPEPAVVEPVKKSKRLDIEPEKTTRLPAAIFEAASAAFKQAKTDHAKEQVEQAKQVAAVRKVKRKRKQRKAATVQEGDSKALGCDRSTRAERRAHLPRRKGVTVQHIVEAKSLSAYDPPPKSMTSAPNEAKRRFMRDQLKRAGPSRADGERRPAHLGIPMSLRQRAPTVGFARSLRRG